MEESLGENGEEEIISFFRISLGISYEIMIVGNDWDGVFLNRCGDFVMSKFDVVV